MRFPPYRKRMHVKRIFSTATCAALGISLISLTPPAYASTETGSQEVLSALAGVEADGEEVTSAPLEGQYEGNVDVDEPTSIDTMAITLPSDTGGSISILDQDLGSSIAMGLPASVEQSSATTLVDDLVTYDHGNGSQTIPVVKEDGSVQVNTYIENQNAPTRYDYDFTLPDGAHIEQADGGGLYFVAQDESVLGGVAPAWAVDAAGASVPTRYEIDGNTITQVVEHTSDHTYPVVADPLWGRALVNSVSWIDRGGVISQSINPTTWNRVNLGFQPAISEGWKEALAKTPARYIYGRHYNRVTANTTQMFWQYRCHQVGGFYKGSWNLEPHRYRSTYQAYVVNLCN